jgi:DNA-binding NarL/FixJ family response regulator
MEHLDAMNGFQIAQRIQEVYPHIRIVAHSIYDDADLIARMFKAGVRGFCSKKSGFDELLTAVQRVSRGERYICRETASRLKNMNEFLLGMEDTLRAKDELFSQRERAVLQLLSEGKSSREIADELFIAERTVESHRRNMVEKSEVKNTAELIAYAASRGLLK